MQTGIAGRQIVSDYVNKVYPSIWTRLNPNSKPIILAPILTLIPVLILILIILSLSNPEDNPNSKLFLSYTSSQYLIIKGLKS